MLCIMSHIESRIWVVQEVAAARNTIVRFGKYEFSWQSILELVAARVSLHRSSSIAGTVSRSAVLYNPEINWHFLAAFKVATNSLRNRDLPWSPTYSEHIHLGYSDPRVTKKLQMR